MDLCEFTREKIDYLKNANNVASVDHFFDAYALDEHGKRCHTFSVEEPSCKACGDKDLICKCGNK
jgi:hypothetical protein